MQIAILIVGILNLLFLMAIAGALSKLLSYLTEEPVIGSRTENTERGLQNLQDERDDRWAQHVSYDVPNYDGVTPRPKNYDGVGDGVLVEAGAEKTE